MRLYCGPVSKTLKKYSLYEMMDPFSTNLVPHVCAQDWKPNSESDERVRWSSLWVHLEVGRIPQVSLAWPLTICLQCPFNMNHRDSISMLGVGKVQLNLDIFWG